MSAQIHLFILYNFCAQPHTTCDQMSTFPCCRVRGIRGQNPNMSHVTHASDNLTVFQANFKVLYPATSCCTAHSNWYLLYCTVQYRKAPLKMFRSHQHYYCIDLFRCQVLIDRANVASTVLLYITPTAQCLRNLFEFYTKTLRLSLRPTKDPSSAV